MLALSLQRSHSQMFISLCLGRVIVVLKVYCQYVCVAALYLLGQPIVQPTYGAGD